MATKIKRKHLAKLVDMEEDQVKLLRKRGQFPGVGTSDAIIAERGAYIQPESGEEEARGYFVENAFALAVADDLHVKLGLARDRAAQVADSFASIFHPDHWPRVCDGAKALLRGETAAPVFFGFKLAGQGMEPGVFTKADLYESDFGALAVVDVVKTAARICSNAARHEIEIGDFLS